jgi:antibiotic biosynthesis monooxygenase (ABM) superfamily enzyme
LEPITVSITRNVKPGHEEEFEKALHEFLAQSLETWGEMHVHVLRPAPGSGSREYGILRKFADQKTHDAFYQSPLYAEWERKVAPHSEGDARYEELSGLETWFTLPGQRAIVPPPRIKMAFVTFLGVYPASMLVSQLLHPINSLWPVPLKALLNSALIVALLAWVIMPQLTRILHRWLYPVR